MYKECNDIKFQQNELMNVTITASNILCKIYYWILHHLLFLYQLYSISTYYQLKIASVHTSISYHCKTVYLTIILCIYIAYIHEAIVYKPVFICICTLIFYTQCWLNQQNNKHLILFLLLHIFIWFINLVIAKEVKETNETTNLQTITITFLYWQAFCFMKNFVQANTPSKCVFAWIYIYIYASNITLKHYKCMHLTWFTCM